MAEEGQEKEAAEPTEQPESGGRGRIGRRLTRREWIVVAAGLGATAAGGVLIARRRRPLATTLVSHFISGNLPAQDPLSRLWNQVPGFKVALNRQTVAQPNLPEQTIDNLIVTSVNNGKDIAYLVEWEDSSEDVIEAIDRFRDAVAVQVSPTEPPPTPFMGQAGSPVHILHWKASWQADINQGFRDVNAAYPNFFSDVFPETLLPEDKADAFYPGKSTGNPLSQQQRRSPVEEMVAEGFGTSTSLEEQVAVGRGIWSRGRWSVAMGGPMQGGEGKATLRPAGKHSVAFAAWSGGDDNVGARKQWSNWELMEVAAREAE